MAIVILGIITALTIPVLLNKGPNSGVVLTKKAYTVTEKIVSSLINDPVLYPDRTHEQYQGFDDTESHGDYSAGANKFRDAFKAKLNITNDDGDKFTTPDGLHWDLTNARNWAKNNAADEKYIMIDINSENLPNCRYNDPACKAPDQFWIYIQNNGRIRIDAADEYAIKVITAHSELRK